MVAASDALGVGPRATPKARVRIMVKLTSLKCSLTSLVLRGHMSMSDVIAPDSLPLVILANVLGRVSNNENTYAQGWMA